MDSERITDQFEPVFGQVQIIATAVRGILDPFDQTFLFQPVRCGRHRSAGQKHFFADGVNRHRSFMQQGFEYGKVTDVQASTGNTCPVHPLQGLMCSPEYKSDVSPCLHVSNVSFFVEISLVGPILLNFSWMKICQPLRCHLRIRRCRTVSGRYRPDLHLGAGIGQDLDQLIGTVGRDHLIHSASQD